MSKRKKSREKVRPKPTKSKILWSRKFEKNFLGKAVPRQDENPKKELKISAIEEGTVIDHVPTDSAFKVVEILDLENQKGIVSIATNLASKSIGKKAIIKVAGKSLTQGEVNKIAIVAPDATVNIIKNYDVREKIKVKLPDVVENVVKCSNPVCITNNEQVMTKFYVVKKDPFQLKCHYCERLMGKSDIKII